MSPEEKLELLRRFAPRLHFDALERWRPGLVDDYLQHSIVLDGEDLPFPETPPAEPTMSEHGGEIKARLDPLNNGSGVNTQLRSNEMLSAYGHDQDLATAGTAYGRVVPDESGLYLQYWLFYPDNPCVLPPGRHDGDWEFVQVHLERGGSDFQPTHLTLAEHGKPVSKPIESTAGGIDVFVAVDSHACYFKAGANPIIPLSDVCEPAGAPGVAPKVVLLPIEATKKDWAHWEGRWGMDRGPGTWLALKLHLKRTPFFLRPLNKVGAGESPPSPGHQGLSWSSPSAFAAGGTARRRSAKLLQRLAHLLGRLTWPDKSPQVSVTPVPGEQSTYTVAAESTGRGLRRVTLVAVAFWEQRPDGTRRALALHTVRPGRAERFEIAHEGELVWYAAGYNALRQRGEPVQ
jgi:hypothetical protein